MFFRVLDTRSALRARRGLEAVALPVSSGHCHRCRLRCDLEQRLLSSPFFSTFYTALLHLLLRPAFRESTLWLAAYLSSFLSFLHKHLVSSLFQTLCFRGRTTAVPVLGTRGACGGFSLSPVRRFAPICSCVCPVTRSSFFAQLFSEPSLRTLYLLAVVLGTGATQESWLHVPAPGRRRCSPGVCPLATLGHAVMCSELCPLRSQPPLTDQPKAKLSCSFKRTSDATLAVRALLILLYSEVHSLGFMLFSSPFSVPYLSQSPCQAHE